MFDLTKSPAGLSGTLFGVSLAVGASSATGALVYEYIAGGSPDDGTNNTWEASVENPSYSRNWSLSGETFLSNAGSSYSGVTSAYSFSGSGSGGGTSSFGATELPLGGTAGNAEGASTTWEVWVRPGAGTLDGIGNETLFETGGNAHGGHLAFVAAGGGVTLRFRTGQINLGNITTATIDVSLTDNTLLNDFIQVVGVVDPDDASNKMRLYVNGALAGTSSIYKNWQGGNNAAGLAKVGGTLGGGDGDTSGAFFGDFASLRLYDNALSDAEVLSLYNAVASPVPGFGGLAALAAVGRVGSRRRR